MEDENSLDKSNKPPEPDSHKNEELTQELSDIFNSLPENLKERFQNIINSYPDDKKDEISKEIISASLEASSFSGPLPHPATLAEYNRIVPDGAERIMKMAENQAEHRMALEKLAIENQLKQSGRGQIFGFIIAILVLAGSVTLGFSGYETVASILGGSTIVSLAAVFVYGKKAQNKEKED